MHDLAAMDFNSGLAQFQLGGDLFVELSGNDQFKNLTFASRQ